MLEQVCLSAGLGTPRDAPEELDKVSGEGKAWAPLPRLQPPWPDSDGWIYGFEAHSCLLP